MAEQIVQSETVREFQEMLDCIYGESNKRFTDHTLLLRLIEETSKVMETARKDKREEMPIRLARAYSWWNAFATRLGINLQEALWNKYPGVCPYCLRDENCICAVEHPQIPNKENTLRRFMKERGREPVRLEDHQLLHKTLYGRQNDRIMPIQTAAHLVEESGEVSEEFRHKNREGIESEMADVGSWIFALANRLEINLAKEVWERYPYECEKCSKMTCECASEKTQEAS